MPKIEILKKTEQREGNRSEELLFAAFVKNVDKAASRKGLT